jgi:glycine/D-amino acid oxidase-like deaminating enzyme
MHVDVLIAGGGVAGLLLARALRARGRHVLVANDPARPAAGRAAVGLLNPVVGKRFALAWQAATAVPAARRIYAAIAAETGTSLLRDVPILRLFRSEAERAAWATHADAIAAAGFAVREAVDVPAGFRGSNHGAIVIHDAGLVDPGRLLDILRDQLVASGSYIETTCRAGEITLKSNGVTWSATGVSADVLVLAGGAADPGATGNVAHFVAHGPAHALPVRPVKGESLLVHAPTLSDDAVVVCGHFLAPRGDGTWICGATQEPGPNDNVPTAAARADLEQFLRERLTAPWTVMDHRAGVRPTVPDLRPLVGRWTDATPVYVFNGLGSRGLVLGPWLAEALADHLVGGAPLPPDVAPSRFAPVAHDTSRWHAVDIARREALLRVRPGDTAVDLTVGNGGDTLWLAEAVGASGLVIGFDIQEEALVIAQRRLTASGTEAEVRLVCADHAGAAAHLTGTVSVAVANLGHLPGSASPVITRPASTLAAFAAVLPQLRPGGALVVVSYVGHAGGREEAEAIARWAAGWDTSDWRLTWHRHPERTRHAPTVLVMEKQPVE